jgi:AcrR family transcriptional regulator
MAKTIEPHMREKIVQASIKLFLRKSFKGTSVEDITKSVNVSKGAFYWHFKSKGELLDTIVEEFQRIMVDPLIKDVDNSEGDFTKKYKYFHKWATDFAAENRDLCVGFMTLAAEFSGSGTGVERKIKAIYAKFRSFLKELVEQGKREGIMRKDLDSDIVAHALNAINNGMLLEWYMNSKIDGGLLAKSYREITLRGILNRGRK